VSFAHFLLIDRIIPLSSVGFSGSS